MIDESTQIPIKEKSDDAVKLQNFSDKLGQIVKQMNSYSKSVHKERFRLMLKNQSCIYAYWDLQESTKQLVEHHYGLKWHQLPKSIKLYDITNQTNIHMQSFLKIEIPNDNDYMFITDLSTNCKYVAEYGISLNDESFFSMIRSNVVATPHVYSKHVNQDATQKDWMNQELEEHPWHDSFSTYSWYTKK
ncbi:DUF4912 domain-containing protein [Litchfieldia salsa]|uniref:DUF4912 domain-containing protein n=1 Tax=Litchfieldia salsa TaxID=930152 RepID=A0A1H0VBV5_9BACI|nr:DUF4912 domain-containing protein [Litchfieldia salsa]SDP75824.1 protein of unknown function [Litchfieldia salsa]